VTLTFNHANPKKLQPLGSSTIGSAA